MLERALRRSARVQRITHIRIPFFRSQLRNNLQYLRLLRHRDVLAWPSSASQARMRSRHMTRWSARPLGGRPPRRSRGKCGDANLCTLLRRRSSTMDCVSSSQVRSLTQCPALYLNMTIRPTDIHWRGCTRTSYTWRTSCASRCASRSWNDPWAAARGARRIQSTRVQRGPDEPSPGRSARGSCGCGDRCTASSCPSRSLGIRFFVVTYRGADAKCRERRRESTSRCGRTLFGVWPALKPSSTLARAKTLKKVSLPTVCPCLTLSRALLILKP
jgi:hypothetical protein